MKDLFTNSKPYAQKPQSIEYIYSDTLKKVRFYCYDKVINEWHKSFCWKHKDNGGVWQKGIGSSKVPLYKQNLLNNAAENEVIYIVEGEKMPTQW